MRWMICRHGEEEGTMTASHYQDSTLVEHAISYYGDGGEGYRKRVINWLSEAKPGDVLEFPLGIVVRTSEHATEIGYDREETGS